MQKTASLSGGAKNETNAKLCGAAGSGHLLYIL
jgi:hypothetical protein